MSIRISVESISKIGEKVMQAYAHEDYADLKKRKQRFILPSKDGEFRIYFGTEKKG